MPDATQNHQSALNLAADLLVTQPDRTLEQIGEMAEKAIQAISVFGGPPPEKERLVAELSHMFAIRPGSVTALDDPTGHEVWLPEHKAEIKWQFWSRYERHLARDFGMPRPAINSLHSLTDKILERIEHPAREGPWDRRGMVVGSVQSGKTANYIGLVCKGIDAGYKMIIVLAGIHSNLRSQTQLRIDEGVTGFDTRQSRSLNLASSWVGVGKSPGERYAITSLTSSDDGGDFKKAIAETVKMMIGSDPVVLVIKKNASVLANLREWVAPLNKASGKREPKFPQVPMLLIDDEADNASINTKSGQQADPDLDVTKINALIRGLLKSFEKTAYVGYTATPFANIFINPEAESAVHGEDLFPRSFIINVEAPSNHVGPAKVFGLDGDPDRDIPAKPGLDVVRTVKDYAVAFPPKHKPDHVPRVLPDSLARAIRCFILTCAIRRARGQTNKHNSMLVHVTRFQNVQNLTAKLVEDELIGLQRRLRDGDGHRQPTILHELKALWEEEYESRNSSFGDDAGPDLAWAVIEAELHAAAAKIVVIAINSSSLTALDYKEHESAGRSVIAVGGDKLSRGLTLEGLSISYFLRSSRMYDTLLQMGRWFGYRPGYLDLCRLFTTSDLQRWYKHIALAEMELRREFDFMVNTRQTPERYGLRVRTHPAGMIVTALNKMSYSRVQELSWAGVLVQTFKFHKSTAAILANANAAADLVYDLGKPIRKEDDKELGTKLWYNIKAEEIAKFVSELKYPPESARASGTELAQFIIKQAVKIPPELTSWTVALVGAGSTKGEVGNNSIGLIERNPDTKDDDTWAARNANILNPSDEALDFDGAPFTSDWLDSIRDKPDLADDLDWLASAECIRKDAKYVATELTKRWQAATPPKLRSPESGKVTSRPYGRVLRVLRPKTRGLLLIYPIDPSFSESPTDSGPVIGVALSFPASDTVLGVEYRVNKVWDNIAKDDEAYEL